MIHLLPHLKMRYKYYIVKKLRDQSPCFFASQKRMNMIQNKIEETEQLIEVTKKRILNFKAIVSAAKDDIKKYEELILDAEEDINTYDEKIYELNIEMQLEETIWPASTDYVVKKCLDTEANPFYPMQKRFKAEAQPFYPPREEGTKLKWVLNDETYRVAIAKKNGILEVKNITDGGGYCHDSKKCMCNSCFEIEISGGQLPPWLKGPPLTKTFYDDEAAWRASLPVGGVITVTGPQISDKALKALCLKPLIMIKDGDRLKELEMRFPGAKMVLTTEHEQLEIESTISETILQYCIYSPTTQEIQHNFSDFGVPKNKKPNLMAEWNGLYICLVHLF